MKTRSEIEARKTWWAHWREADYTWRGLANKPLYGWSVRPNGKLVRSDGAPKSAKPASLQDLWRSEATRLVKDDDGLEWTVIHAPLYARSGAMCKAGWDAAQRAAINGAAADALARLPSGALDAIPVQQVKRRGSRLTSLGRHWPLRMDGAVLLSIPPALSSQRLFKGERVAFGEVVDLGSGEMSWDLRYPLFERRSHISGARSPEIRFREPLALRAFYIETSTIGRLALFGPEVFGDFGVHTIKDADEILITRATLRGQVEFEDIQSAKITLTDATIEGDFSLSDIKCDALSLSRTTIDSDFAIDDLTASTFTAITLHLMGEASIKNAKLTSKVNLHRAKLDRGITFEGLSSLNLDLSDAVFGDKVELKGASIGGRSDFARAHFMKSAYFNGARLGATTDALTSAFKESRFESFVDFRGAGILDFAAFDGANFKAEVRFDQAIFKDDQALASALLAASDDERLASLENGLRALKQAAETVRHRVQEQTFYRYELMVRRRHSQAGNEEVVLSHLYDFISHYGSSFARPIGGALVVWLVFALIYIGLAAAGGIEEAQNWVIGWGLPIHAAIPEALNLSARSMLNLFGVWSLRAPLDIAGLEAQLLHSSAGLGFLTRGLSSVQSVLSGILLFLTALAARRRFQIS